MWSQCILTLFNIEKKKKIHTQISGEQLSPGSLRPPYLSLSESGGFKLRPGSAAGCSLLGGEKKNPDDFCMQDLLREAWVGEV